MFIVVLLNCFANGWFNNFFVFGFVFVFFCKYLVMKF